MYCFSLSLCWQLIVLHYIKHNMGVERMGIHTHVYMYLVLGTDSNLQIFAARLESMFSSQCQCQKESSGNLNIMLTKQI